MMHGPTHIKVSKVTCFQEMMTQVPKSQCCRCLKITKNTWGCLEFLFASVTLYFGGYLSAFCTNLLHLQGRRMNALTCIPYYMTMHPCRPYSELDVHRAVHHNIIPIVKPTRCTIVSNYFILEWHSTCFRRSFRPSSGVQDCTYSNRHLLLYASKQTAVSVWQMPVAVCTVLNSWWWTERLSETCIVSF